MNTITSCFNYQNKKIRKWRKFWIEKKHRKFKILRVLGMEVDKSEGSLASRWCRTEDGWPAGVTATSGPRPVIVAGLLRSIALDGRVIAGYILFYSLLGNSHLATVRSFSPGPPVIAHIHRLLGNLRSTASALLASRGHRASSWGRKLNSTGQP